MSEFMMCWNYDYMLLEEEGRAAGKRLGELGRVLCPSCGSDHYKNCPYDEKTIQEQLDWQQEIAEKGVIQALVDLFSREDS